MKKNHDLDPSKEPATKNMAAQKKNGDKSIDNKPSERKGEIVFPKENVCGEFGY